ncbi:hypothetical protein AVEN_260516-1, partial [Araneus ventricosus]
LCCVLSHGRHYEYDDEKPPDKRAWSRFPGEYNNSLGFASARDSMCYLRDHDWTWVWHLEYRDMSCCRMCKQELAYPVGVVMVGLWVPPPVIVRTSFGRVAPWPGDALLGLSTRAIAATVTETHRAESAPDRGDLDMNYVVYLNR